MFAVSESFSCCHHRISSGFLGRNKNYYETNRKLVGKDVVLDFLANATVQKLIGLGEQTRVLGNGADKFLGN